MAYRRMFAFYAAGYAEAGHPSEVADVIHEACTTDDPQLRYTCGWGGHELANVRCAVDDADWVELGAITDDVAYAERFRDLLGVEIA